MARSEAIRRRLWPAVASLPVLIALAPVVTTLIAAFRAEANWSLGPMQRLLGLERLLPLLRNSLGFAAIAAAVAVLTALPAAVAVFKLRVPLRRPLLFLCVFALMVPPFVTANGWRKLLGMVVRAGDVPTAGVVLGLTLMPWAILTIGAGLASVDADLEEQALTDARPSRVVLRVSLPQSLWAIALGAVIVFVMAVTDTAVSDLMGVRTFGEEVYTQYQLARPAVASATAFPVLATCALLLLMARRLSQPLVAHLAYLQRARTIRLALGRHAAAIWLTAALVPAALLAAPVVDLVIATGSAGTFFRTVKGSLEPMARSAWLALAASAVCMVAAVPAAYAALRRPGARLVTFCAIVLLLGTPPPLTGIGLIRLLNRPGLPGAIYDSSAITLMAMAVRALPYGLLISWAALALVPEQYEEQARLDGAALPRRLLHVHVPVVWPGLLLAWLATYLRALTDVGATILVIPPGRGLLSTHVLNLAHYGVYANLAALALAMALMVLPFAVVVWWLRRRLVAGAERGTGQG